MLPVEIDYFHLIANASLVVQFVLLVLLLFSVTSWAIIFIKFKYLRVAFKESADFTEFFWKSRDLSGAFAKAKQFNISPVARVFRIGYLELKRLSRVGVTGVKEKSVEERPGNEVPEDGNVKGTLGRAMELKKSQRMGISEINERTHENALINRISGSDNVQRALRRAITSEVTRMTQLVPFLATTGNTSPFIGLFGTVWGIMNSFHGIGVRGSANLAIVAPGIAEALIATAAGLAVAIPSVIFFNHFTQKIRTIESELQSFSADFINIIERDFFQSKRSGR